MSYESVVVLIAIGGSAFSILFYMIALQQRRLTDRYRIKYGFDRDLEMKEMDKPERINEREHNFKRRTFRDNGESKQ